MPARLDRLYAPLWRCARGELPVNVALVQLLMQACGPLEVEDAITKAIGQDSGERPGEGLDRLLRLREFWNETPEAFATVKAVLDAVKHSRGPTPWPQSPADWSCAFDRAAGLSPAAGVALYSLGRTDLLFAATNEILARMREWDLLAPPHAALDIGCGSGRITTLLANEVRVVIGVDVSLAMLKAARRSAARLDNAHVVRTSGFDLGLFRDQAFDLVCAVDSFPYLFLSGLAELHIREATRVLKPGGSLLVLNYSYRGNDELDRADIVRLARELDLTVRRNGTRDLEFWDGLSFLLQKRDR
ncbi:MAG TPA: class I SAM-dependent methyltransferase [Xanthobacteraceae bacterium]|jgi:ubiquinone/menaquinone biosynthesis C-methylase UbiE